jgi:hypothetical protein
MPQEPARPGASSSESSRLAELLEPKTTEIAAAALAWERAPFERRQAANDAAVAALGQPVALLNAIVDDIQQVYAHLVNRRYRPGAELADAFLRAFDPPEAPKLWKYAIWDSLCLPDLNLTREQYDRLQKVHVDLHLFAKPIAVDLELELTGEKLLGPIRVLFQYLDRQLPELRRAKSAIVKHPILTEQAQAAFDYIKQHGPTTGKEIAIALGISQVSTITSHIIPKLKPLGVINRRGAGYVFVDEVQNQ